METKTIPQMIEDLKKEKKEREELGVSEEHTGHWSYDDVLEAKLSTLQEAQKMFLEEIKSMRKHKDTKLIHNFDGEEIDYLISAKELKSKIGGEDD